MSAQILEMRRLNAAEIARDNAEQIEHFIPATPLARDLQLVNLRQVDEWIDAHPTTEEDPA